MHTGGGMGPLTRGDVLRRAAAGALTIGLGGSIAALAASGAAAGTEPPSEEDLAWVRMGASAELLAIDFYDRAIASHRFSGAEREYLRGVRSVERAHYAALAAALVDIPPLPADFRFLYPPRTFTAAERVSDLGVRLETVFVGVYLGAVEAIVDPALRLLAAQIAAAEGRHAGVIDSMAGSVSAGSDFPAPLDIEQATDALAPYLGP